MNTVSATIIGTALVLAALVGGVMYYAGESAKADALVMTECMKRGGSFYVSWNWKHVCTLKQQ